MDAKVIKKQNDETNNRDRRKSDNSSIPHTGQQKELQRLNKDLQKQNEAGDTESVDNLATRKSPDQRIQYTSLEHAKSNPVEIFMHMKPDPRTNGRNHDLRAVAEKSQSIETPQGFNRGAGQPRPKPTPTASPQEQPQARRPANNELTFAGNKECIQEQEEPESSPDQGRPSGALQGAFRRYKLDIKDQDEEFGRSKSNNQPRTQQIQVPYRDELCTTLQLPKQAQAVAPQGPALSPQSHQIKLALAQQLSEDKRTMKRIKLK